MRKYTRLIIRPDRFERPSEIYLTQQRAFLYTSAQRPSTLHDLLPSLFAMVAVQITLMSVCLLEVLEDLAKGKHAWYIRVYIYSCLNNNDVSSLKDFKFPSKIKDTQK